jgi:hypothetical protein
VQLGWCKKAGVPRTIITHCGTQIVTARTPSLQEQISVWSRKYGLRVEVAYDGMELVLRRRPRGVGLARR